MTPPAGYRPDIDGLRAIAVLAVAFFHAKIPGFSGGYVGVDVFFVISGYLITRLIAQEAAEGRFSFWRFYERRARRLLPALFVMAAAVVVFTLVFRSPRDADIFGESVSLFAVFASNFFFYDQLDYFGDPADFYPLLHMWSLAVEEQFYLVLPPLFLLLAAWFGGPPRAALACLAAASFLASVWAVRTDPQLAFFHTPFRMWELLIGGLIALSPPLFRSAAAREAATAAGLLLILAPIPFYDETTLFPGPAALPPVLGCALVIAAGVGAPSGGAVVGRALSVRPIVYVGLASYSFYLWHWPALAAARYLSFEPLSAPVGLAVLAGAFLVAAASLHLIERPFRRPGGVVSARGVFVGTGAGIAALLAIGLFLQETRGWPGRFPALAPILADDAIRYGPAPGACATALERLPETVQARVDPAFCAFGPAAAERRPRVVLWGDSHARALAPGLADWASAANAELFLGWSAICPPALGVARPVATRFHDCVDHNDGVRAAIEALDADLVILSARWPAYSGEAIEAGLARTLGALAAADRPVLVVGPGPTLGAHPPTVLFRAARIGAPHGLDGARGGVEAAVAEVSQRLVRTAAAHQATYHPLIDAICGDTLCPVADRNGAPLFADSHHLSRVGARLAISNMSPALSQALQAAMAR